MELMAEDGDVKSDIKVPNTDVGSKIKNLFETVVEKDGCGFVTILSAMEREIAIACRQEDEGCVAQCSVASENLIARIRSSPHNSNTSPARTVT